MRITHIWIAIIERRPFYTLVQLLEDILDIFQVVRGGGVEDEDISEWVGWPLGVPSFHKCHHDPVVVGTAKGHDGDVGVRELISVGCLVDILIAAVGVEPSLGNRWIDEEEGAVELMVESREGL